MMTANPRSGISRRSLRGFVPLALTVLLATVGQSGADAEVLRRPSGGKAVAHRSSKVVKTKRAPSAETFSIGRSAIEPTLGVAPDGGIFYAAGGWTDTPGVRVGGATEVMHSSDRGTTWEAVTPRVLDQNVQQLSVDPYVLVDSVDGDNGRVFTIDLTVACSYMSFSDDEGETWTTNPLACGRPVNDHQTLFSGPPVTSSTIGYANILYYCWNDVLTSSCAKSLDGGITFHPTGSSPFVANCGGLHGHGITGPDGTIYLPRHVCGVPTLAISRDEGLSWSTVRVSDKLSNQSQDPSVAVDRKGNLYYLWVAEDDRLPYLSVSRDSGETWGKPVAVAVPAIKEANLPSITAGGKGKIALVYYGSSNSPWARCAAACTQADYEKVTWNGYLAVSSTALRRNPLLFTGVVNHPRDPLVRQMCGPGRCHNVMDFIDVTIGRDGVAYGAFVDTCMPTGEPACTEDNPVNASGANSGASEGLITRLRGGPSLR